MANLDITESYKQYLTWMMHSWNTCCKVYAECACVADVKDMYACVAEIQKAKRTHTAAAAEKKCWLSITLIIIATQNVM